MYRHLTKCQTKGATVPFLAPKCRLVDSEALLRRFAKYTLSSVRVGWHTYENRKDWEPFSRTSCTRILIHFITFWFFDAALLPESETRSFSVSVSKDLTSGHETIVFGGGNYIVWRGKLYCLARETIFFRARFACFLEMECIVFLNKRPFRRFSFTFLCTSSPV